MKFLRIIALCGALSVVGGAAFAGAVDGPTSQDDTVEPGKIDVYRVSFSGGKKAVVRVKAHGDDVNLFIYDTHDTLITKDDRKDAKNAKNVVPTCSWTPKDTDEFKIKIVNNEPHSVDYKLETN